MGPLASQVYLFYGEEDFLIEEKIKVLRGQVPVEVIDAQKPDIGNIISVVSTPSLLWGERLVLIQNADLRLEAWDGLVESLKAAGLGTRIIFHALAVSRSAAIYKLIDKIGEVCEFKPFTDWDQDEVVSWIVHRAASTGKKIDHPAAVRLQEICGSNLRKLVSEIEKLATYTGAQKEIREEDVLALASPGEVSTFALADALAKKDLRKALELLQVLYRNRVELIPAISLLAGQYRTMLHAKFGNDPAKIASLIGARPYYVKKCMASARNFNKDELAKNLELLLEADLRLKTGESRLSVFEVLLASLCGR